MTRGASLLGICGCVLDHGTWAQSTALLGADYLVEPLPDTERCNESLLGTDYRNDSVLGNGSCDESLLGTNCRNKSLLDTDYRNESSLGIDDQIAS